MKSIKGVFVFIALSTLFFVAGCALTQEKENPNGLRRGPLEVEVSLEAAGAKNAAAKTYCLHSVVSMTPTGPGNNCNPADVGFAVNDTLCINCVNGVCRQSTTFVTDDGVWLRACEVTTSRSNGQCKSIWPRGSCKSYISVK